MTAVVTKWRCIESEEMDADNWVQVAFRFIGEGKREYRVFGHLHGQEFDEGFWSGYEDNRTMAYQYYWEKLDQISNS